ncbi:hypothetical protein WJX82_001369 [Trebouxia sp. C0006]
MFDRSQQCVSCDARGGVSQASEYIRLSAQSPSFDRSCQQSRYPKAAKDISTSPAAQTGQSPRKIWLCKPKGSAPMSASSMDASRLWSFAFSSNYTPTAAPLYQESDFLTQQAVSLKEAQLNLRKHRADWQAVPEDLSGLPLSSDPMWQAAALDKLKLKPLCNKLTAVDVKHVALGGNSRHAMDAEMQCVHCLLHDDAVKDSLMSFFEENQRRP